MNTDTMKKLLDLPSLLFIIVFIALILTTGCASSQTSSADNTPSAIIPEKSTSSPATVTTTVIESPIISRTILTVSPSLTTSDIPTTNKPTLNVSTIATPVPQMTKLAVANDPLVQDLSLTKFDYGISDCIMKQVFPDIAKDPDYGINSAHPKLVGISNETWTKFYLDYNTGQQSGQSQTFSISKCEGIPISESNTWDFVWVYAKLIPRNARPSDYTIIVQLNAKNKEISQLVTIETLTLEQPVKISSWVPMKRNEIEFLQTPKIYFNRLTNN